MSQTTGHSLSKAEAEKRLAEVRSRIDKACRKSGREPGSVRLLAVSKTFPQDMVETYVQAGLSDFGESYIQEARNKVEELARRGIVPHWHFIGHLQTNKAKYAAALFSVVHSVDSLDLAVELDRRASALNRKIRIYTQVNVSGEDSKSGMEPDDLPRFLDEAGKLPALTIEGLMTIPPWDPDPELARPHFIALRKLKERCAPHLSGLSMGMSGDLEVAIEEGATIVRVGTALFGERDYS